MGGGAQPDVLGGKCIPIVCHWGVSGAIEAMFEKAMKGVEGVEPDVGLWCIWEIGLQEGAGNGNGVVQEWVVGVYDGMGESREHRRVDRDSLGKVK